MNMRTTSVYVDDTFLTSSIPTRIMFNQLRPFDIESEKVEEVEISPRRKEYAYSSLLPTLARPAFCQPRSRPIRRCVLVRVLWRLTLFVALYIVCLEAWVNLISKSHPSGFDAEEQRLGIVELLLLPLTPYIRAQNKKAMPVYDYQGNDYQQVPPSNLKVAVMPDLLPYTESDLSESLDFRLGSELSGCTPKFVLSFGENKYLYKPNEHKIQVWNELVAFLVNKFGAFDRIPPVHPYELPFEEVKQAVEDSHAVASLPFVKCDFDLPGMSRWIKTSKRNLIGTLQLMVKGVWKRSKTTQRARARIGKWTDKRPSVLAQREISTRTLFDFLIGNYDRYNNGFVQNRPNGDRILVYIDQGTQSNQTYVYSKSFKMTDYCRFYWKPIQALRIHAHNLTETIVQELESNEMTRRWNEEGLIDILAHPTVKNLQDRVTAALKAVDECLDQYGHDYVFTNLSE